MRALRLRLSQEVTMAPRKKVDVEQPAELPMPRYEEIAARAYEIHESGDGEGPLDDWLRAERELTGEVQIAA
jgi:Protein of unknown function (DUF2934)